MYNPTITRPGPQQREPQFFPGQPGIRGSDAALGWRQSPDAVVLYVDSGHAAANDSNIGTDPQAPFATVTAALASNRLTQYSEIRVNGPVSEAVVVAQTLPNYCWLRGIGIQSWEPTWTSGAAASDCLLVRAEGWRISGFAFTVPSAAAAIFLDEIPASSYSSYKTQIDHCRFDGFWSGLTGVEFSGAPHRVVIDSCEFLEIQNGGNTSYAIQVTDSSNANPYECVITNNLFWENDNHIGSLGNNQSFNMSLFQGNVFGAGVLVANLIKLDLRGGSQGHNIVTGNVFGGDYSNTGGYYGNAAHPDMWVGNLAEDVAEGEVGDNGFTTLPPAA